MRAIALVAFLAGCGVAPAADAGPLADTGAPVDAWTGEDAGEAPADAGEADGGTDAGGGLPDAGTDASVPDSGTDAGPPPPPRVTKLTDHCALRSDGEVRCWGTNDRGQLGNGSLESSDDAVRPVLPGPASDLGCSPSHCCAVVERAVWCWGHNLAGQVGRHFSEEDEPLYLITTPRRAVYAGEAVSVDAGPGSSCAIDTDGAIDCWGEWLTEAPDATQHEPRRFALNGGTDPTGVFVGSGTACVIASSPDAGGDALFCFGRNDRGQAGPFSSADFYDVGQPVAADVIDVTWHLGSAFGLEAAGTLLCWGDSCGLAWTYVDTPFAEDVRRMDDVSGVIALGGGRALWPGEVSGVASTSSPTPTLTDAFDVGPGCVTDGTGVYCPDPIDGVMD